MIAGGRWVCQVRRREMDAARHRKLRMTVEYDLSQRRGRLRREREAALTKLSQLTEEANLGA